MAVNCYNNNFFVLLDKHAPHMLGNFEEYNKLMKTKGLIDLKFNTDQHTLKILQDQLWITFNEIKEVFSTCLLGIGSQ